MNAALVIQTAFAGDLILTLPMIQEMRRLLPGTRIDVLCIPGTAELLTNHPAVDGVHIYDKHNGNPPFGALIRSLRADRYSLCISPHRSMRSALIARGSGARQRISFDRSAGGMLYTDRIPYDPRTHEAVRNLNLLGPIADGIDFETVPRVYPADADIASAEAVAVRCGPGPYICIAPGSVWATKRWTPEGFSEVVQAMSSDYGVLLIGGEGDRSLCDEICRMAGTDRAANAAGELSFLSSAALLGGAAALVSNDSAPVHLASAMRTPVVEIYGATVPEFGFFPFGVPHRIVQREDLSCRPCGVHGGNECPISTFACMRELSSEQVVRSLRGLLADAAK